MPILCSYKLAVWCTGSGGVDLFEAGGLVPGTLTWTEEGGGAQGAGKTRCPRLGEWRQPHNERPGALTRRTPTVKARVVPVRPARCTPGTGDWHGVVTSISGNPLRHRFRHGGQWPWKARRQENIRQPKLLRNGEGGCASPALEKKYAKMRRENALRISPWDHFQNGNDAITMPSHSSKPDYC